ncbi:MAG: hypothetical protein ACFB4I_17495 [Cyanophyceae cyanobacterium]
MANPNPKQENLVSFASKWQSGKTKLYRLPEAIAPQVLELAHQIDQGHSITVTSDSQLPDKDIENLISQHFKVGRQSKTAKQARQFAKAILRR